MIKPEHVPHSAINALLLALRQRRGGKEALAAALNAWPGAFRNDMEEAAGVRRRIILPLPEQESSDGK